MCVLTGACICALGHDWLDCLGVVDSGETTIRGGDLPMSGVGGGEWICFGGAQRGGLSALVGPGVMAVKSELSREQSLGRGAGVVM